MARAARRERRRVVECDGRVTLGDTVDDRVVRAGLRPGEEFDGVEPVELGGRRLCVCDPTGPELAGRHVRERQPVAVPLADDRREIPGGGVVRVENRPRRHHPLDPAGVAVARLVLVGDRDPVAPFDQRAEVRS